LLAIFIVALTIPSTKGEEAIPLSKQLALLKNSKILLTLAITFFWITGYAVLYSYITPFLQRVTSMSEQVISMTLFAFGIATLIGTKFGGLVGNRVGVSKSLVGSMVVHIIALVLLSTISGSTFITIPLLIIWAVAAWTTGPIQQFNILSIAPEASRVMFSLNNSFLQFGFAAGAAIGRIAVGSSSMLALSWTGVVSVVIAVFIASASYRVAVRQAMD
jgi:MFS transporter, DHA1 family, putative efflux transporter